MGRKSKRSSDGSQTRCQTCGRAVRGSKGLKAHQAACIGPSTTPETTIKDQSNDQ